MRRHGRSRQSRQRSSQVQVHTRRHGSKPPKSGQRKRRKRKREEKEKKKKKKKKKKEKEFTPCRADSPDSGRSWARRRRRSARCGWACSSRSWREDERSACFALDACVILREIPPLPKKKGKEKKRRKKRGTKERGNSTPHHPTSTHVRTQHGSLLAHSSSSRKEDHRWLYIYIYIYIIYLYIPRRGHGDGCGRRKGRWGGAAGPNEHHRSLSCSVLGNRAFFSLQVHHSPLPPNL